MPSLVLTRCWRAAIPRFGSVSRIFVLRRAIHEPSFSLRELGDRCSVSVYWQSSTLARTICEEWVSGLLISASKLALALRLSRSSRALRSGSLSRHPYWLDYLAASLRDTSRVTSKPDRLKCLSGRTKKPC